MTKTLGRRRLKGVRVGVVGAAGFIGKALSSKLAAEGATVDRYDKTPSTGTNTIYPIDLDDAASVEIIKPCDLLINLAAEHRDDLTDVSRYYAVNVEGAQRICEIAEARQIASLLFFSSSAVYGDSADSPYSAHSRNRLSPYGESKLLAEEKYRDWQGSAAGRCLTIIRPSVVFGPGNRGNVFNLMTVIAAKRFVLFGAGANKKSMTFVDNLVDFTVEAISRASGLQVLDYADKPDLTIFELVAELEMLLNSRKVRRVPMPTFLLALMARSLEIMELAFKLPFGITGARVKKLMASTVSPSSASRFAFRPSKSLFEGLEITVNAEFRESIAASDGAEITPEAKIQRTCSDSQD